MAQMTWSGLTQEYICLLGVSLIIATHSGGQISALCFAAETEERQWNTEEEVFEPAEGDGRTEGRREEAAGRGDQAERRDTRHGERHRRLEEGDLRTRRHYTGQGLPTVHFFSIHVSYPSDHIRL